MASLSSLHLEENSLDSILLITNLTGYLFNYSAKMMITYYVIGVEDDITRVKV